jgi:hypothetical protein
MTSAGPPPTVEVTWAANAEPDISGYEVYSGTTLVCSVNASANLTTYQCPPINPPQDGTYTYDVVAYRWGATYSTKTANQVASKTSGASKPVTITGVKSTTATTLAGAGGTLGNIAINSGKPAGKAASLGGIAKSVTGSPAAVGAANVTTTTSGGAYNPTLPYGALPAAPPTTSDPAAISVPATHKGSSVGTIAAVGAGLLIAVIAMHGLWLRSEVRRAGALEAIDPES